MEKLEKDKRVFSDIIKTTSEKVIRNNEVLLRLYEQGFISKDEYINLVSNLTVSVNLLNNSIWGGLSVNGDNRSLEVNNN